MEFGIDIAAISRIGRHTTPDGFQTHYITHAEDAGFSQAWMGDHIAPSPAFERSWPDQFSTLAHFSGKADTMHFGTGICILPLRHPVLTAKKAANIQHLTGNRFTVGVGMGGNEEDYDAVGMPFETRADQYMEAMELVHRLFTEEDVSFDGEYYSVDNLTLEPELDVPPRLVTAARGIFIDGERQVTQTVKDRILRAADWIDGWIAPTTTSVDMAVDDWDAISTHLADHGHDTDDMVKIAEERIHVVPDADTETAIEHQERVFEKFVNERGIEFTKNRNAFGSVADIQAVVDTYEDHGFDQVRIFHGARRLDELYEQVRLLGEHVVDA